MATDPIRTQPIQPTHKVTLKCPACGEDMTTLAAKVKPPGSRRPVWVYPYGYPECSRCGGRGLEPKVPSVADEAADLIRSI